MTYCTIEVPGHETVRFDCPQGLTLLDAATQAGWELPHSCRRGHCESCRVSVIEGTVEPPALHGTTLLCQSRPQSDVRIAAHRIEPLLPGTRKRLRARLYRQRMAASDVAIVELRFPPGTRVPFKAGQYLQVLLEGEVPRSFSMANPPKSNDGVQLHIRVLPGSLVGERILGSIEPGQELEVELPFGDFHLREGKEPVLLVAAGTGFAPMQSLLEDALPRFAQRSFVLYWGARSAEGLYALEQVRKWQRRHSNFQFFGVISDGDTPQGFRTGLVHEAVLADHETLAAHQAYVCGPPVMVAAARDAFKQRGLPIEAFYADSFCTTAG